MMLSHARVTGLLRTISLLAVLACTIAAAGCSDDGGPAQPTTFALLITNLTPQDYDVYRKPSASGDAFAKVGVSVSGATYRINPLSVGTTYVFRLSRQGTGPASFDFEREVSSTGGDVAWEVKQ